MYKLLRKKTDIQSPRTDSVSVLHERASFRQPGGSLTLEAAFVLPLFLLFCMAMMYFLIIISLQSDIQLRIDETARSLGKSAYLSQDSSLLTAAGVNPLSLRAAILDDLLTEKLDNSDIKGGASGVSTLLSTYDSETGILDIVVTYKYVIPYLPENISTISFMQRQRSRVWTGEEISGDGSEDSENDQIVYITPTGTVYHLTKSCSYLDLSIRSASYSVIGSLRNKSGGKYTRCRLCAKTGTAETVYITDYGSNWHLSLSCSGLKRTVIEIKLSEVGDRLLCSKCGADDQ